MLYWLYIILEEFEDLGLAVNVLVHLKFVMPCHAGGMLLPSGDTSAVPKIVSIKSPGGVSGVMSTDITLL